MTKYTSQYKELAFIVNGEFKRFSNGEYNANTKAETDVLDKLTDAIKQADEKPKPAPKTTATKAKKEA